MASSSDFVTPKLRLLASLRRMIAQQRIRIWLIESVGAGSMGLRSTQLLPSLILAPVLACHVSAQTTKLRLANRCPHRPDHALLPDTEVEVKESRDDNATDKD